MHEISGFGRYDTFPIKLAAIQQHLSKAHVVPGGREEAITAAGEAVRIRRGVGRFDVDALVEACLPCFNGAD